MPNAAAVHVRDHGDQPAPALRPLPRDREWRGGGRAGGSAGATGVWAGTSGILCHPLLDHQVRPYT
eukprot:8510189-Pyramimonas_sp.AAC.2